LNQELIEQLKGFVAHSGDLVRTADAVALPAVLEDMEREEEFDTSILELFEFWNALE
jgi:hypothetical protein